MERETASKREEVLKLLQPVNADTTAIPIEGEHAGETTREGMRGENKALTVVNETGTDKPASDLTLTDIKKRKKQKAFLAAYVSTWGNVCESSRLTGTHERTHYYWLKRDQYYQVMQEKALDGIKGKIEAELLKRGFVGDEEELVYKGQKTGETIKRKSDIIAMFTAKKLMPEYRDNATQIGIAAHGDIEISFSEPNKQ